jgi:hypothetical protein
MLRVNSLVLMLGLAMSALAPPLRAEMDAQQLAREVAASELRARGNDHTPWMYTLRKHDPGNKEVREVVHTNDGPLFRTLSRNGQPLNEEQQRREDRRIQELLHDPDKQQEQARKFQHDLQGALNLMKILPEAFLFRVDRQEGELVHLNFEPNPQYRPGTRAARVSHAMRGTMLVHPGQKRLVELKGVITHDVKFGVGILGLIKKGGSFQFQQTEGAPGQWVASLIDVNISGRVLLFRSLNKRQHWIFSDFRRVPQNLSLAQGAEMLKEYPRAASQAQPREHR